MINNTKAHLILEDGSVFEGISFGSTNSVSGEVVFNTAMSGYPESLTDPSYNSQILTLTFPMIGNYGAPPVTTEKGLQRFIESEKIHIRGLVVTDYTPGYSHWNAIKSLGEWLKENDIPAVYGIDTCLITKTIRERGAMLGKLIVAGSKTPEKFDDPSQKNLVAEVSCKEVRTYAGGDIKIVLVDCGCKCNIIRCLVDRGATVVRTPWDYDFSSIDYHGVMISNGPGNPMMCATTVGNIKKAISKGKPIFGICLGNQLLSLAAGATTYKLKYGHRSHNQPVIEKGTNRALITSQNHGYAVDTATLDRDWEPFFVNLNDGTNEGVRHKTKPFRSVQFHPEATGGPTDAEYLFDEFISLCRKYK